jgi:hypothetical protein
MSPCSSTPQGEAWQAQQSTHPRPIPELAVDLLTEHQEQQQKWRADHGWKSEGIDYYLGTRDDTVQVAESVHDKVQALAAKAGLPGSWTPRELRPVITKGAELMDEAIRNHQSDLKGPHGAKLAP